MKNDARIDEAKEGTESYTGVAALAGHFRKKRARTVHQKKTHHVIFVDSLLAALQEVSHGPRSKLHARGTVHLQLLRLLLLRLNLVPLGLAESIRNVFHTKRPGDRDPAQAA